MNAKKCDRCKRYYDQNDDGSANLLIIATDTMPFADYEEINRWELCPDCIKHMLFHLHNSGPME